VAGGLKGATRLGVSFTMPFDLWRDWARLDFRIHRPTRARRRWDVTLDLPETIVRSGDALWLTLVLDGTAELIYRPGESESR